MLVWLWRQVVRLGEVSLGWCPRSIGEIKDEPGRNRGSTLAACLPRGCYPSCLWHSNLPPDARRGGKRQLNIPLNLLFYCRNVPQQPLLAHQAERRERHCWGQKRGVRVVRGVFPLLSKHSWQGATKVEACGGRVFLQDWSTDTQSFVGKNLSPCSSSILKRLLS